MAILDSTPVTLAEMRAFLNITEATDTGQDALLENLLDDLSDVISDWLGLDTIINAPYTEYYDGDGSDTLFVEHYPIITITSLADGTQSFSATDYHLYEKQGKIVLDGDYFENDNKNILIVYSAGHGAARANVPRAIKTALKMFVSHVYKKHSAFRPRIAGENTIINFGSDEIPKDVESKLAPYRAKRFGSV